MTRGARDEKLFWRQFGGCSECVEEGFLGRPSKTHLYSGCDVFTFIFQHGKEREMINWLIFGQIRRVYVSLPLFLFSPKSHPFVEAVTSTADKNMRLMKAPIIPLAREEMTCVREAVHLLVSHLLHTLTLAVESTHHSHVAKISSKFL